MASHEVTLKVSDAERAWMEHQLKGMAKELAEIEQVAGKVLGYPWYCDNQDVFPDATTEDGVCTGEHTPATITQELAGHYERARELLDLIAKVLMADVQGQEAMSAKVKGLILHNIELLRPGLLAPMIVDKPADGG